MKLSHLIYKTFSGRILLMVLAIVCTLGIVPANSAPVPGTITIVLSQQPDNLDPGNNIRNIEGSIMMRNIIETLTERNPADSSIKPRLATSWKQIDAKTWHFNLKKGVKFHDGEDFNADAVIFSIKRIYDKKISAVTRDKLFSSFKMEGTALGNHKLEIKTDTFQPLMPTMMGQLPICSPNTQMGKWTRSPIGTGPYKFVKWDAGTQIVLERFDGYWGKRPQVKKAVYVWRKESSVRASMVLTGEADLAPDIAIQDANHPTMDYSFLNSETTILRIGGAWEPPLNDRRVRMALNYAIDRNSIRGSVLSKAVVPATQIIVPNIFGHNPDLKVWPYDPQKAKQLVDEARKDGVPVDKEILLIGRIGHYPGVDELLEVVMSMYKAVGLNVKPKLIERGQYSTFQNKPYPSGLYMIERQHDNNKGDAAFSIFYQYHCKGHTSVMCDKTVNDLIERAMGSTGEGRRSLFQAAFKRSHEEIIPDVLLFHMVGYARVGKRINFKPSMATTSEIQLEQITFK
jgi:peptide/nickel transport system substrate-binding protein